MAARTVPLRLQPEVIDLVSDDSEPAPPSHTPPPLDFDTGGNLSPADELPFFFDAFDPAEDDAVPGPARREPLGGRIVNIDGEDVFIPDEEVESQPAAPAFNGPPRPNFTASPAAESPEDEADTSHDGDVAMALGNEGFTADTCLQRVLEIFPGISHEHVHTLYNDFDNNGDYENLPGSARLDNIIEQLVSGTNYPKQEKGKQAIRKRKREDSISEIATIDAAQWERQDREAAPGYLKGSMQAMLKAEYPEIPVTFIHDTLAREKHFYQTYVALANAKDSRDPTKPAFRGRPSTRNVATANTIATNCGWEALNAELLAARGRVQVLRSQRAAEDARKKAEEQNLQKAKERGETSECQACFEDLPLNRQIHCDGPVAHFTCYDCALIYIKSEVGDSRCKVLCTAGCGAPFPPNQLNLLSDKPLLEKLAELEQEKAIRDAGLEDLEECPFCDYKAIVPPIEMDFEFRCAAPECEKVSCRRCKSVSHIPNTCEQHAKDNKVNSRHKIEEAMTAAMIRSCGKCKKQFIKEYGCNKMTCPSCGNLQCYVCSESLKNYDHFDQAPSGRPQAGTVPKKCPLYDNVEERHEREVKEAEAAARAQVMEENPDIQQGDLDIKVSDAVTKATAARIKTAGGNGLGAVVGGYGAFGFPHMPHILRAALGNDGAEDDADDDDDDDDDKHDIGHLALARARVVRRARAAAPRVPEMAAERAAQLARAREAAHAMVQQRVALRAVAHRHGVQPANPPAAPNAVDRDRPQLAAAPPLRMLRFDPAPPPARPRVRRPYVPAAAAAAAAPALFDPFAYGDREGDGIDPLQPPANRHAIVERARRFRNGTPADEDIFGVQPANGMPGVRQQRENFEHLERMRVQHDEDMRQRLRDQQGQQQRLHLIQERQRQLEQQQQQMQARQQQVMQRHQEAHAPARLRRGGV